MLRCSSYPVVGIIDFMVLVQALSTPQQTQRYHTEPDALPQDSVAVSCRIGNASLLPRMRFEAWHAILRIMQADHKKESDHARPVFFSEFVCSVGCHCGSRQDLQRLSDLSRNGRYSGGQLRDGYTGLHTFSAERQQQ
jgi:hypothetical protein